MPIFKNTRKRRKARKTRSAPLLLFDFDGTLADTIEMGLTLFNEIAGDYGLKKVRREDVAELRHLNTRALLDRLGMTRLMAVKVAARLRSMLKDRVSEVELLAGVGDAVLRLQEAGYAMAILSSNSAKNIRRFLKHQELIDCFEFVEGGASLFGKAERLRGVIRAEKLAAVDILYIGDETRDMEAAREAGVRAVAACWGVNEEETMLAEDPEFVLNTPAELLAAAKFARENKPKPREHGLRMDGSEA